MQRIRVWDPLVRIIHWAVALMVIAELTVIDEDWALHRWVGYAVLGFVLLRLVWGLIGPRHARFSAFPPSLAAAREHVAEILRGERRVHLSHNPLGALMAYNLWAALVALWVTGYMLGTNAFFGVEWVEELHEAIADWVMISVLLHVGGVVFETWRSGINLVRAMISGEKVLPGPAE